MTLSQYQKQIPTLPELDTFNPQTVWAIEPQFTGETQINYPNIFQTPHTNSISCIYHIQHSTHAIFKYVLDSGYMRANP